MWLKTYRGPNICYYIYSRSLYIDYQFICMNKIDGKYLNKMYYKIVKYTVLKCTFILSKCIISLIIYTNQHNLF